MRVEHESEGNVRQLKSVEFGSTVIFQNEVYLVVNSPENHPEKVMLVSLESGVGQYLPWETMVPIVPYKAVRCSE